MPEFSRTVPVDDRYTVTTHWAVPEGWAGDAIVIAHGAGNDMDSPFLRTLQTQFVARGLMAVRFNFPYKEQGRKAPDRMPLLEATWRAVLEAVRRDAEYAPTRLFLSGKSMGGRVASHLAASGEPCDGVVFFGYPLHPPRKPEKERSAHLFDIRQPMLFIEGTRDPLCDLERLEQILAELPAATTLHVIEGGDHSFKTLKKQGRSEEEVLAEAADASVEWMGQRRQ